ncbi:Adenosine deaminase-like protein [Phanerochaete sordida]|uniref:Adenosine deaminase-like protein n=1 Tax=Phanerochaete sordida TaxID=48140 RepID=A0A9P3GN75_9APHY|nr:Adenosine deaminase-like protein [Phanerochaete sordida]
MSGYDIAGYAADALASLTTDEVDFLRDLPKAELHAHLNGCIPIALLQKLANEADLSSSAVSSDVVKAGIERLKAGVELNEINDFFGLFPAIYALTASPATLAEATRAVLAQFLESDPLAPRGQPMAAYLELRTTPRATQAMSRREYLEAVLAEVERYPPTRAALLVSLDRRMDASAAEEVVGLAVQLKQEGRRVVGVDLCGDPLAGNMADFEQFFRRAKEAGLGVTLHIAETPDNTHEDTLKLLSFKPDRLGHATFLDAGARDAVFSNNACVEICLTSNLLCKTASSLEQHHIRHYLEANHPITICTDDTLPFRNNLLDEYALLLAKAPQGLGLTRFDVERISAMSMASRFALPASRPTV